MKRISLVSTILLLFLNTMMTQGQSAWQSTWVQVSQNGSIHYAKDKKGNRVPDFSQVGYHRGERPIPFVATVLKIGPSANDQQAIQEAIHQVSRRNPDKEGFRGAVELLPGTYNIPGSLYVDSSGVIIRGSGNTTKLVATGTKQRSLIVVSGKGKPVESKGLRKKVIDPFIPTGMAEITLSNTVGLKTGDRIIHYIQAKDKWIKDLKMDSIVEREGTKQWQASEYTFAFERRISAINGNRITLDIPVMMELDEQYVQSEIYPYQFPGRIKEVGIENLTCISEFEKDTSENHGWLAIEMNRIENGWVRNVESYHFGQGCVYLDYHAKNITVSDCKAIDPKSIITGGRRYSFSTDGQQNLFMHCFSREARHDYATGSKVCGPNVFWDCSAEKSYSDIGPHHRWTIGTLYDNIRTNNQINVQDRGNWGSGHGWSGVTQVFWNCSAGTIACQDPWIGGRNFLIGGNYQRVEGRFKGRPQSPEEGNGKPGLQPASLYQAQLNQRINRAHKH